MFSIATPQFVQPSELTQKLEAMRKEGNSEKSQRNLFRELADAPLPPNDQRDGKVVGFFDQGLMTGASVLLTPVVVGLAVASFYGLRFGIRWVRR